jgi:hypothetical protein
VPRLVSAAAREARTGHYALPLPEEWADRTVTTLVGPFQPGGYAPNVVVTRELLCDNLGLGGFADGQAALIRDQATEFAVVATEHGTLDGERAILRTTRWRIPDETEITQLSAYCLRDGHGIGVVCTAPTHAFPEAEPGFRSLLAGFRFAQDEA